MLYIVGEQSNGRNMALLTKINCPICKKIKEVCHSVRHYPDICDECQQNKEKQELENYLLNCANLSLDERLKKIETFIYKESKKPDYSHYFDPIG